MERSVLPSLSMFRLFEAASREGTFQGAASSLHLTSSAVSHGIARLERELGIDLFVRNNRGIELTDAGRTLQQYVSRAFAELHRGSNAVRRERRADTLSIRSLPTFAAAYLAPKLAEFEGRVSGLRVALELSASPVDLKSELADISIELCERSPRGLFSEVLFPLVSAPVCAPRLAEGIRTVSDLAYVTRIAIAQYPESWDVWFRAASSPGIPAIRDVTFDTPSTALLAAIDGIGIVIAPLPIVAEHLKTQRLAMPFPIRVRSRLSYRLSCRKGEEKMRKIAQFRGWLMKEISDIRAEYAPAPVT